MPQNYFQLWVAGLCWAGRVLGYGGTIWIGHLTPGRSSRSAFLQVWAIFY